jgi:hypothetical protein
MKVIAIDKGYFGQLREIGDQFEIHSFEKYSKKWMNPVGWDYEKEKAASERLIANNAKDIDDSEKEKVSK